MPDAGRHDHVEQRAQRQHQEAALDRDAEDDERQRGQDEEVDHADRDVGQLLAEQVLEPSRRRDVEVDDRAQLLLAHDADRHEDRRDEDQEQRRDARHDRVDALERGVVHVPLLDRRRVFLGARSPGRSPGSCSVFVDAAHVLRDGLAAERHRAVHLRQDLGRRRPGARRGRSSAGSRRPARCRPTAAAVSASSAECTGGVPVEVPRRSRELLEIGAALGRLIAIERGVADVLDVGGDAEAEDQHQQRRADEGERQPDGIAEDLHGLVARVGEHPADPQPDAATASRASSAARRGRGRQARRRGAASSARCPAGAGDRVLHVADERVLQAAPRRARRSASAARRRPAPCPRA